MISSVWFAKRLMAGCLVMLVAAPDLAMAATAQQQAASAQQTQSAPSSTSDQQAPNAGVGTASPAAPVATSSQSGDQNSPSAAQAVPEQAVPDQPQSGTSKPVGTAAAPYGAPNGVAVSRPAGAVIAPAKQRRARAILIRVGLIVGGAVAIGTVVALSRSSSGRPQ
jgi:cytoskeletal protein RodZ